MNSFSSLFKGIKGKLLLMILIPILLLSFVSIVSMNGIKSQGEKLDSFANSRMQITLGKVRLMNNINVLGRLLWIAHAQDNNFDKRTAAIEKAKSVIIDFDKVYEGYKQNKLTTKGSEFREVLNSQWPIMKEKAFEAMNALEKNNKVADDEMKKIMLTYFAPKVVEVVKSLEESVQYSLDLNDKLVKETEDLMSTIKLTVIVTAVSGCVFLLIFGTLISFNLSKKLTHITEKISSSSYQVNTASNHLSSASQQLSNGASNSASSLEETVASIEELSSMVKLNANHAKEAAALSVLSSKSADEGEIEIKRLIQSMEDIAKSSKQIEEIINVIDDIAFQTNLLALNAAVEAARAGEQGRGFAVVADAVRNLAQRSATAAKDINNLIRNSVQKSEQGSKIAEQSGVVLKNIVSSIKKISELNEEISSASQQQAEGIEQINIAMTQLDTSTQNNANSAEEVASSSTELSSQAEALQSMVSELENIIGGLDYKQGLNSFSEKYEINSPLNLSINRSNFSKNKMHKYNREKSKYEEIIPFGNRSIQEEKVVKIKKLDVNDGF